MKVGDLVKFRGEEWATRLINTIGIITRIRPDTDRCTGITDIMVGNRIEEIHNNTFGPNEIEVISEV